MFEEKSNNLTLSWQSIFRLYLPIFLIIIFWYLKSILLIAVLAFILASLLERPIDYLAQKLKNRFFASLLVYLIAITIFSLLIYTGFLVIINNFDQLRNILPQGLNFDKWQNYFLDWQEIKLKEINFSQGINDLETIIFQFSNFFQKSFNILGKILGGTFTAFLVILLSFFINTEKNGIEKGIRFLVPWRYEEYVIYLWGKARKKVSNWFFSQLILSIFVGLGVYFVLSILGVRQAEFLALLAASLDFVPYLGPFIAFLIIAIFALSQNLFLGLIALVSFIFIQLFEGLVAPSLRAKAMKINPLIIIFSLLIGGKLAGAIGVIIILPLVATFVEFLRDLRSGRLESYLPLRRLL
ncbi:MAG: AI-2E family transporter [Minisyncoccia bacterium]